MTTEGRADTVRGRVFGEVAQRYDIARPGYAGALVDEVLTYARLGDRAAVEAPAGTDRDGRCADVRSVRCRQAVRFDTEGYLTRLTSVAAYRVPPEHRRERTLADTTRLFDTRGGGIGTHRMSDLFLARAR